MSVDYKNELVQAAFEGDVKRMAELVGNGTSINTKDTVCDCRYTVNRMVIQPYMQHVEITKKSL